MGLWDKWEMDGKKVRNVLNKIEGGDRDLGKGCITVLEKVYGLHFLSFTSSKISNLSNVDIYYIWIASLWTWYIILFLYILNIWSKINCRVF